MHSERDAVGRRAINTICLEIIQLNTFKSQGSRRRNRMTHRGLLNIGRDNTHLAKTRRCFRKPHDARTVNTVVIRNQDSHLHMYNKRVWDSCWSIML